MIGRTFWRGSSVRGKEISGYSGVGTAPHLGCGDRAFESHYSDHNCTLILVQCVSELECSSFMQIACYGIFLLLNEAKTANQEFTPDWPFSFTVFFLNSIQQSFPFQVSLNCSNFIKNWASKALPAFLSSMKSECQYIAYTFSQILLVAYHRLTNQDHFSS